MLPLLMSILAKVQGLRKGDNMAYKAYVDAEYYQNEYNGSAVPKDKLEKMLRTASRHIDSLTYNRIVGRGLDNLTEFQQDMVKEVCCLQADFEYENADMIETVISAYSLNGASVQFGNAWNVMVCNGVAMKRDTYQLLQQTGLCCRLAVGR